MVKILVVDDDPLFRTVVREMLSPAGHTLIEAENGSDAMRMALKHEPDLILLDVILPGMLGTEVSRALRSFSKTAHVPIILVSIAASELSDGHDKPTEYLADDFLHKPFSSEILLKRIDRLLERAQPTREGVNTYSASDRPDRRQNSRVPLNVNLTIQTAELLLHHPILNISTGGVCLEVSQQLPKGLACDVSFSIPQQPDPVRAECEVSWSQELENRSGFAVGLRFTCIDPADLERLRFYVNRISSLVKPSAAQVDLRPADQSPPGGGLPKS